MRVDPDSYDYAATDELIRLFRNFFEISLDALRGMDVTPRGRMDVRATEDPYVVVIICGHTVIRVDLTAMVIEPDPIQWIAQLLRRMILAGLFHGELP